VSPAATLEVAGLAAGYGAEPVLAGVDVRVPAGACLAVVGRSGCGKSTLLHVLAGLLPPLAGSVTVGGDVVAAADWTGAGRPGCSAGHAAYMFQRDLLLPWKTAVQNVALPARLTARGARGGAGADPRALEARAGELLVEFGLADALQVAPAALSGGMRQRVALARTLLLDRGLILLDEPFGGLDAVTRAEMRHWMLEVMATHPATWVLVTHDVEEAVLLGDYVAVLHGRPARVDGWRPATLDRVARTRVAAGAVVDDDPDEWSIRELADMAAGVRALLRPDSSDSTDRAERDLEEVTCRR
jgi:ABC-type nitrate/sulfonate/bicarbonate transport system ATPase subunit